MWEERLQLKDFDRPSSAHHDEIDVPGEIHEHLPAGTAGRREAGIIRDDRNRPELRSSLRDCLEHRCPFSTNGKGVGTDLDIASREDLAVGS